MQITRNLLIFAATILTPIDALGDSDVTGYWTGQTTVSNGGGVYDNTFTLLQNGAVVSGSVPPTQNGGCTYSGSVAANQIMLHADCASIGYFSDSTATLSPTFDRMDGTFLDSQGTTGTFFATKQQNILAPGVTLNEPPLVSVSGNKATITLLKFDSVAAKSSGSKAKTLAAKKGAKIVYELTIKGPEKRSVSSKKNEITLKNLKPGNYSASYRVVAFQGDKKVQATKKSPAATFTIQK